MSTSTEPTPPSTEPVLSDAAAQKESMPTGVKDFLNRIRTGDLGSLRVLILLAIVWIIFQSQESRFLSATNIVNPSLQITAVALISVGVVLVLLLGEIDLSVGAVSGVTSAIVAVLSVQHGWAPVPAIVWQGGGIVAGEGTLITALLAHTGFTNNAAARGLAQASHLPLEAMLADPPRVILAAGNSHGDEDRLRVVVFGQDGITNSYTVDAGGNVNLPLIGTVPARGTTTQQLAKSIADRLRQGYVREPHVTVEVETYRPFFILGEVTTPGQYPYVANMTVETAVAIAGGFSARASKKTVELTRNSTMQRMRGDVPLSYPLQPGDTIVVKERWF